MTTITNDSASEANKKAAEDEIVATAKAAINDKYDIRVKEGVDNGLKIDEASKATVNKPGSATIKLEIGVIEEGATAPKEDAWKDVKKTGSDDGTITITILALEQTLEQAKDVVDAELKTLATTLKADTLSSSSDEGKTEFLNALKTALGNDKLKNAYKESLAWEDETYSKGSAAGDSGDVTVSGKLKMTDGTEGGESVTIDVNVTLKAGGGA